MATRKEVFALVEAHRSELPSDLRLTGKGVTLDYLRGVLREHTDLSEGEITGKKVETKKKKLVGRKEEFSIDNLPFAPKEGFEAVWAKTKSFGSGYAKKAFFREIEEIRGFPLLSPTFGLFDFWVAVADIYIKDIGPKNVLESIVYLLIVRSQIGFGPEKEHDEILEWALENLPESTYEDIEDYDLLGEMILEAIKMFKDWALDILFPYLLDENESFRPSFGNLYERAYKARDSKLMIILLEELLSRTDSMTEIKRATIKVPLRLLSRLNDPKIDELVESLY